MKSAEQITVFFDGACPLCRREIAFYRRRKGADKIHWSDVSAVREKEIAPGLTKDRALARFHVLEADGTLVSGGTAFARLWEALPAFRRFGRLFRVRPLAWILDRVYDGFLRLRPWLQARLNSDAQDMPRGPIPKLRAGLAGESRTIPHLHEGCDAHEIPDITETCRADEIRHRDEARQAIPRPTGAIDRTWQRVVGRGSAVAAALARRL